MWISDAQKSMTDAIKAQFDCLDSKSANYTANVNELHGMLRIAQLSGLLNADALRGLTGITYSLTVDSRTIGTPAYREHVKQYTDQLLN